MSFFFFISKGLQHCPDLSAYAAEEINLLKGEIVAVEKVSIKLELEMREAMDIKGQCFVKKNNKQTNKQS